jgi:TolB-like protein
VFEWGHSAFTLNLGRGLKDGNADMNADGYITANELGLFLNEKVSIDSDNLQTPQYGRMTTQEGEFIFINSRDQFGIGSVIGRKSKIMPANIAIWDFEGIGISIHEARVLTQRLASEIISLNVYQLFERSKVNQLLREQEFHHSGCVDATCAVEIGKLVGVQHIVVGTISKIGNTYSVDSRMIDVESGKSLISAEYSTLIKDFPDSTSIILESTLYVLPILLIVPTTICCTPTNLPISTAQVASTQPE